MSDTPVLSQLIQPLEGDTFATSEQLLPAARAEYDSQVARWKRMAPPLKDVNILVVINKKYDMTATPLSYDEGFPERSYVRFPESARHWTIEDAQQALPKDSDFKDAKSYPDNNVYKEYLRLAELAGLTPPPKLCVLTEKESALSFGRRFEGGLALTTVEGNSYIFIDPKLPADEIFGVLAHELGHAKQNRDEGAAAVLLRAHNDDSYQAMRRDESNADLFAVYLGAGESLMKSFRGIEHQISGPEHPQPSERMQAIAAALEQCRIAPQPDGTCPTVPTLPANAAPKPRQK